jgi:beta-lactamase class A
VYEEEDGVEGSGILKNLSPGLSLPLKDALMLMITLSDNTATNLVLRYIGLDRVNDTMESLGLQHIQIFKRIDFEVPGPLGMAPASELSALLKKLHARELISAAASNFMWNILVHQQYNTLMTRYLPYELLEDSDNNDAPVQLGSKSGSLEGVRNDVGIVTSPWGSYTVALLSEGCRDLRFHVDNEAYVALPHLTRLIFDYFLDPDLSGQTLERRLP